MRRGGIVGVIGLLACLAFLPGHARAQDSGITGLARSRLPTLPTGSVLSLPGSAFETSARHDRLDGAAFTNLSVSNCHHHCLPTTLTWIGIIIWGIVLTLFGLLSAGFGIGAVWDRPHDFAARLSLSWPLSGEAKNDVLKKPRIYFIANKSF